MKNKLYQYKKDIYLFVIIIVLALVAWLCSKLIYTTQGNQVRITIDGKTYGVYSIKKSQTISLDNEYGKNIVKIQDNQVFMQEADCPDQICVDHKPISHTNETIICLPHRLVVEVISDTSVTNELDAVVE